MPIADNYYEHQSPNRRYNDYSLAKIPHEEKVEQSSGANLQRIGSSYITKNTNRDVLDYVKR